MMVKVGLRGISLLAIAGVILVLFRSQHQLQSKSFVVNKAKKGQDVRKDSLSFPPEERSACGVCIGWEADYLREAFSVSKCQQKCDANDSLLIWNRHNEQHFAPEVSYKKQLQHMRSGTNQRRKRIVLFHKSDEFCNEVEFFEYYQEFDVVFRQYACRGVPGFVDMYSKNANVFVIPLGYGAGMFTNTNQTGIKSKSTERAKDVLNSNGIRDYIWSFVGTMKMNRKEAIDVFQDLRPNYFKGAHMTAAEVGDIYRKSKFVLSGRGNWNLDCFRHYESSIHGSIPIIVATPSQVEENFADFGNRPPWLFATSWTEAKTQVVELLENPVAMENRSREASRWWISEMDRIKEILAGDY